MVIKEEPYDEESQEIPIVLESSESIITPKEETIIVDRTEIRRSTSSETRGYEGGTDESEALTTEGETSATEALHTDGDNEGTATD